MRDQPAENPQDGNPILSIVVLIFVIGGLALLLFGGGCKTETVREVSAAGATPTVVQANPGYDTYILPSGDFRAASTQPYSSGGSGCCGAGLSLSVSQSGTDVDGGQNQQVAVGSTDVGQDGGSNDELLQGEGGGGVADLEEGKAIPIEIVTGTGEWFSGTATPAVPGRIAIDAQSPEGASLVGTMSTYINAGYPLRLTYIGSDGEAEKLPTYAMEPYDAVNFPNGRKERMSE